MGNVRFFVFFISLVFVSICRADISPSTGIFGGYISFYEYYASDQLVGGYYHHYCLFAEVPSFESPYAIFIYANRNGGFEVVYRRFPENVREEMNRYFMKEDLDPHRAKSQMKFFMDNEIAIETVRVDLSKRDAETLIDKCSKVNISFQNEDQNLDGSSAYFSSYMNPGFITGRPVLSDEGGLISVKSKLFEFLKGVPGKSE